MSQCDTVVPANTLVIAGKITMDEFDAALMADGMGGTSGGKKRRKKKKRKKG